MIPISVCAFANRETDSLINIAQKYEKQTHFESDINYINTLIRVAESLLYINPDSSFLFAEKAYNLSIKHKYHKSSIKAAFIIGDIYTLKRDPEKIMWIVNEILPVIEKTDRKSLGNLYSLYGASYVYKGIFDINNLLDAKNMFQKSLEIGKEYNDTVIMISAIANLSVIHDAMLDYSQAVELLYQAIGLTERSKNNDTDDIIMLFHNVSSIYFGQKMYDKALVEIHNALNLTDSVSHSVRYGGCLLLASKICLALNDLDKALEYTNMCIDVSQKLNFRVESLEAQKILSTIYCKKGLYDKALKIANEVLVEYEKSGTDFDIIYVKLLISDIYYAKKQYDLGLKICNEILERNSVSASILGSIHIIKSRIYEAQNNGMKALEHYKLYKIFSDSLYHNNLDEQIIKIGRAHV